MGAPAARAAYSAACTGPTGGAPSMSFRPRSILAAALVGAVAAVPLAAGATAAPARHQTARTASVTQYVTDATRATSALADFGKNLQQVDSLSEFRGELTQLRR